MKGEGRGRNRGRRGERVLYSPPINSITISILNTTFGTGTHHYLQIVKEESSFLLFCACRQLFFPLMGPFQEG